MAETGIHSSDGLASPLPPLSPEELLRHSLNAGGIGLWEYDPRERRLSGSAAIDTDDPRLRQIQLSLDEFIARIVPDHRAEALRALERAADTGTPAFATYELERPDGVMRWIQTHLIPERDAAGIVIRVLAITRDVTDLRHALAAQEQLIAQVTQARDVAERTVQARNNFISSTVHDLRTPMTSIRGRTQLLLRRIRKMAIPEQERTTLIDGLSQIELGITHMNDLLGDLQDAAFIQIGRPLELHRVPIQLVDLVDGAIAEVRPLYPEHRFVVEPEGEHPALQLDETRMRRVLTNLLTNAAKYSPSGSTVRVSVTHDADATQICVRDEGIGIPAEEQPRIFERFYRASNAPGANTGSGIGLAGVRQIARQHGGEVTVESEEGRGSTFVVRLPHQSEA